MHVKSLYTLTMSLERRLALQIKLCCGALKHEVKSRVAFIDGDTCLANGSLPHPEAAGRAQT